MFWKLFVLMSPKGAFVAHAVKKDERFLSFKNHVTAIRLYASFS